MFSSLWHQIALSLSRTRTRTNITRTPPTNIICTNMYFKSRQNQKQNRRIKCKVPPKITPFGFVRDLNVGDRTSIQCVVGTGDLPLVFTWLKDGIPLQVVASVPGVGVPGVVHGHHHIIDTNELASETVPSSGHDSTAAITIRQYDDFTSALSITSVSRGQAGNYSCRVQNDAAIAIHSAVLRVNGRATQRLLFL